MAPNVMLAAAALALAATFVVINLVILLYRRQAANGSTTLESYASSVTVALIGALVFSYSWFLSSLLGVFPQPIPAVAMSVLLVIALPVVVWRMMGMKRRLATLSPRSAELARA